MLKATDMIPEFIRISKENVQSPVARFLANYNNNGTELHKYVGNGERTYRDPDLFYLLLKHAAFDMKYARDIMLLRYALEADIPYRFHYELYYYPRTNSAERCVYVFTKYVHLMQRELMFTEREAVRILSLFAGARPYFPKAVEEYKGTFLKEISKKEEHKRNIEKKIREARLGSSEEKGDVAEDYYNGWKVDTDRAEAYKWADEADKYGDEPRSRAIKGNILYTGDVVPKDQAKGLALLMSAADDGDGYAAYVLAISFWQDFSNKNDEAFKWAKRSYELGYRPGEVLLGIFYADGVGTQRDKRKALPYLLKNLPKHDSTAELGTAWVFENEPFKNTAIYSEHVCKSAELGKLSIVKGFAEDHEKGSHANISFDRIVLLLRDLAHSGDAEAKYKLACYFRSGKAKADDLYYKNWLDRLQDEDRCGTQLARESKGTPLSDILARRWYEDAVMSGYRFDEEDYADFLGGTDRGAAVINRYVEDECRRVLKSGQGNKYEKKLLSRVIYRNCGNRLLNYVQRFYSDLAEHGDCEAACALADFYLEMSWFAKEPHLITFVLKDAIAAEMPDALLNDALIWSRSEDKAAAEEKLLHTEEVCLKGWKERRDPGCAEVLGRLYEERGDKKRAYKYYEYAAEKGPSEYSLMKLLPLYLSGDESDSALYDAEKAKKIIGIGEQSGYPYVLAEIGRCYWRGRIVDRDPAKADRLFMISADLCCRTAWDSLAGSFNRHSGHFTCAALIRKRTAAEAALGFESRISVYTDMLLGKRIGLSRLLYCSPDVAKAEKWLYYALEKCGYSWAYRELSDLYAEDPNKLSELYCTFAAARCGIESAKDNLLNNSPGIGIEKIRTSFRPPAEHIAKRLKELLAADSDIPAKALGYLLLMSCRNKSDIPAVTSLYLAFCCGSAKLLRSSGYERAEEKLVSVTGMPPENASVILACIASAYGSDMTVPEKKKKARNRLKQQEELIEQLRDLSSSDFEQVTEIYRKLAEIGNGDACYFLGRFYEGHPKHDRETALSWFMKGAELGNRRCEAFVGQYLLSDRSDRKNRYKAAWYLSDSAPVSLLGMYFLELCDTAPGAAMREDAIEWAQRCPDKAQGFFGALGLDKKTGDFSFDEPAEDSLFGAELKQRTPKDCVEFTPVFGNTDKENNVQCSADLIFNAIKGDIDAIHQLIRIYTLTPFYKDQTAHALFWTKRLYELRSPDCFELAQRIIMNSCKPGKAEEEFERLKKLWTRKRD